jgi:hypothetical protein
VEGKTPAFNTYQTKLKNIRGKRLVISAGYFIFISAAKANNTTGNLVFLRTTPIITFHPFCRYEQRTFKKAITIPEAI